MNCDWRVDVGNLPSEAGRQNTDDGVEVVVEADRFSEDVAVAEKMALPEEVAEDGDVFDFGLVAGIFCGEGAAEEWRNAEKFETVGRETILDHGFRHALFH